MLLEVGQTYAGRYRITRKLGEGAMGAVYEAEHILIHRRVALKVLLPTVAERHGALHRFEREAQAAGRIGSPHIVEVLDMGDLASGHATARFLVMELLEGETLAERLRARGRLRPEEAAPLACQVLAGLGAAHAVDIVHRDLKPANVFLVRGRGGGDFVKLLDFGVSKFSAAGDDMSATAPGATLGTPYYMSPEQAKGAPRIDPRSDLYSVGVILYQCVTGQVPFDAGTFNELIFRIVLESPPPLESFVPDVDPGFVAIVQKAMAREPGERFQSARELHDALAQWLAQVTGKPVAPGVVPWDGGAPFVPSASGSALPAGPGTEMLEHAQTRLFVPRARWPVKAIALGSIAVLAVIAGAAFLVVRSGSDKAAVAPAVSASSMPSAAMPPPLPSASASAAPTSSVTAQVVVVPAPTSARSAASLPKKAATAAPATATGQRTVPSEL
ncbi:MAG: serine/threonine-protein kinase [Minicystis sp.]